MNRSPAATARRTVRRAVTWRPKQRGSGPIDIAELISPLRYDVLVRADFMSFLGERPADEPIEQLVDAATDQPYYTWFRVVAMARFRPWVLQDAALTREQFTERVESARALRRSVLERGFDPRFPVTLRSTTGPRRTDTGVVISKELHVGDGGHRLALVLSQGLALSPEMYRIDSRPMPLIDNTGVLARELSLSDADYAAFLGRGYGEDAASLPDLLERLERRDTEAAREVAELARAHGRAHDRDGGRESGGTGGDEHE